MSGSGFFDALRPFLWMAFAAFLAGFLSYTAVGGSRAAAKVATVYTPAASAPASDEWNLPKRI